MNIREAIEARHSVRQYQDLAIPQEITGKIESEIDSVNKLSGLHIQLVKDEPKAFDSFRAHYGNFSGVKNYIARIGKKSEKLDELVGYYGEALVLLAQQLGLNSCWVARTYKKIPEAFAIEKSEKLARVIALGYGKTSGVPHKSKKPEEVSNVSSSTPDWFLKGVQAALLAPTARNQQKFKILYEDGKVTRKPGFGFYTKIDRGIAKCHFEIATGKTIG